jgi:hypothetical protein
MKAKQMRQLQGTRQPHLSSEFVPGIKVFRPVLAEDGTAYNMQGDIIRRILDNLPKSSRRNFRVFDSARLVMRVVDQQATVTTFKKAKYPPDRKDAKTLARSMKGGLTELLSRAPDPLPFQPGKVTVSPENKEQVSVFPHGWRGHKANYAELDEAGKLTPLGLVVAEQQLCIGAVSSIMKDRGRVNREEFMVQPQIAIVGSNIGELRGRDKFDILGAAEACMPEVLYLGNPEIVVRLGRRETDIRRYTVGQ